MSSAQGSSSKPIGETKHRRRSFVGSSNAADTNTSRAHVQTSSRGGKISRAPKPRLTHFVALPLGHHQGLQQTISTFTSGLLQASPAIPGLDASIVIPARRMHLTLGVMSLHTTPARNNDATSAMVSGIPIRPRTLSSAIRLLHELKPRIMEILGGEKLCVALKRMDIMRADPEKAHVMWLGPSPDDEDFRRLKTVCDLIHQEFKAAGLAVDEGRPLKLHCTMINTTYRKPRGKARQPFSYASILASAAFQATEISTPGDAVITRKGPVSVNFGKWDVDEVQICEMGSWGAEGEYVCVGRCSLG